jgi:hypothetical protein
MKNIKKYKKAGISKQLLTNFFMVIFAIVLSFGMSMVLCGFLTLVGLSGYQPRNRLIIAIGQPSCMLSVQNVSITNNSASIITTFGNWKLSSSKALFLLQYQYDNKTKKLFLNSIGNYGIKKDIHLTMSEEKNHIKNLNWQKNCYYQDQQLIYGYADIAFTNCGSKFAAYPTARHDNREFISLIDTKDMTPKDELPLPLELLTNNSSSQDIDFSELAFRGFKMIFFENDKTLAVVFEKKIFFYDLEQKKIINKFSVPKNLNIISNYAAYKESIYVTYYNNDSSNLECYKFSKDTIQLDKPFWNIHCHHSGVYATLVPAQNIIAFMDAKNEHNNLSTETDLYVYNYSTNKRIYHTIIQDTTSKKLVLSPDGHKIAISRIKRNKNDRNYHVRVIDIEKNKYISLYHPQKSFGENLFFVDNNTLLVTVSNADLTMWDVSTSNTL